LHPAQIIADDMVNRTAGNMNRLIVTVRLWTFGSTGNNQKMDVPGFATCRNAPKDQSNRRKNLPYAAWEIHPVMKLNVQ
jgi:hypothetical protein